MSAAIHSDEQETNLKIDRQRLQRAAFLAWWLEWADPRACNTTFIREIAWESWKASHAQNRGLAESRNGG